MFTYRPYLIAILLLLGLIGCQNGMTVIKARLVERDVTGNSRTPDQVPAGPNALQRYSQGLALLAAGDTTGAVQQFSWSVEADSTTWPSHYMLGLLEPAVSEDGCLQHFRMALEFAPAVDSIRSQIYTAMAICYERQTALAFAEQNYWTALQLNPHSDVAREGLERVRTRRQTEQ